MTGEEKNLLELYRALPQEERQTLRAFAEFLASRVSSPASSEVPSPVPIPRAEGETVIKAIKRLRATYPMLDPRKLLHETSHYVTQHVMQGRPAEEVIEELEIVFARHYEKLKSGE